MTEKNKGRAPGKDATPKTTDSPNHTGSDPFLGWLSLAKPSRDRQPKRSWKRSKQRGRIDAFLAAQLALLVVLVVLIVGGVRV
jgi:hypothetical protein